MGYFDSECEKVNLINLLTILLNKITLGKEMIPEKQSQFFEGSVHLVYAVVIAQSFTIAGQIFIPITNLYNYEGLISAIALIFVYFFVVAGWYGFFKSVRLFPHKRVSKITLARYGCAFFNTFILYYMITLTARINVDYLTLFWLIPLYLSIIIVVHFLKSIELTKGLKGIESKLKKIIIMTFIFCGIFIGLAVLYGYLSSTVTNLKWDSQQAWTPIFLILAFFFSGWYR